MENLGTTIKAARKQKGITQEELAERSRINLRTIQRIENGQNTPRRKTLALIAIPLGLDIAQLVGNENDVHARKWGALIAEGFFLLILNFVLMGVFGYLTLDSDANLNSKFGALLLSFFIPVFIVSQTRGMSGLERILKFGSGFFLYFTLIMILHGFVLGFVSLLFPCFGISLALLYYGGRLFRR